MSGNKAKQSKARPRNDNTARGSNSKGANISEPAAQKSITITPFSVDMFQQTTGPNDDPNQPAPTFHPTNLSTTVRSQVYSVHQCAIISRFQPLPKPLNPLDPDTQVNCIARILEIRALNPQNVYVRVYWLYRPQELPNDKQAHHGAGEMIATNHMEIVDALRVVSPVHVEHWRESDDGIPPPGNGVYWRQTYHFLTQKVSTAKPHCTCRQPINPDSLLIRCTNPTCSLLLHSHCVIDAALRGVREAHQQRSQGTTAPQPPTSNNQYNSNPPNGAESERFKVALVDSRRPHHMGRKRLLFGDEVTGRSWEMDVECLGCGTRVQ
ncbi:MAG: hypothetical protein Q9219_007325 [cf. Caloplaca sp. 3 TL-2023]